MNKLAVTVWNYKGGVGKSTIALILAEIAASKGLHVVAADLDEQQNLANMLNLAKNPLIEVRNSLPDDFEFLVIDTHPAQNDTVIRALSVADIVLIPIFCDYPSLMNIADVFDFVYDAGVGRNQAAIVKNCMINLQAMREIEAVIDSHHLPVAGRLPRCNSLVRTLASGFPWDKRMRSNQRNAFVQLYNNLWLAHQRIISGSVNHIWRQ